MTFIAIENIEGDEKGVNEWGFGTLILKEGLYKWKTAYWKHTQLVMWKMILFSFPNEGASENQRERDVIELYKSNYYFYL